MESIPPAYVAWRAGTITLFVVPAHPGIDSLDSILGLLKSLQIQALSSYLSPPPTAFLNSLLYPFVWSFLLECMLYCVFLFHVCICKLFLFKWPGQPIILTVLFTLTLAPSFLAFSRSCQLGNLEENSRVSSAWQKTRTYPFPEWLLTLSLILRELWTNAHFFFICLKESKGIMGGGGQWAGRGVGGGARGGQREDRTEWPGLTGPMYFVFCRLYPFSPSHHGSLWVLPTISLILTNTVSLVQACLFPRGFVGPKKKTIVGLLVFNPLWPWFQDGLGDVLRWSTARLCICLRPIL